MKKIILSLLIFSSAAFSLSISPEIGASGGNININGNSYSSFGANARIWLGFSNFVIAPQYKYQSISGEFYDFSRQQYGLSVGYKFDLSLLSLTPYVGANYSTFSRTFENSFAYNGGLRLKLGFLPLFASVEYEYQSLKSKYTGYKTNMDGVSFNIGLSF
ncbi:hypothetical protein [uncultured Campylobacter sp.]|uniref:hypothetical protein n=1 Tax=uncultured Campylobacter sp. TaxID=218934 RepID=UPI002632E774|nr:hypothetical protein [uncultured Campylobacter sp.]